MSNNVCKHNDHTHMLIYFYIFLAWNCSETKDFNHTRDSQIRNAESEISNLKSQVRDLESQVNRLKYK